MYLLHARNLTFQIIMAILGERQHFHYFNDLWTDSGFGRQNNLPKFTAQTQEIRPLQIQGFWLRFTRFSNSTGTYFKTNKHSMHRMETYTLTYIK